jgi:tetratricopeptide (TPR) repeat protein
MCAMSGAHEPRRRRKIMVLAAGTLGLAAALTAAATLVPGRDGHLAQTYLPRDASVVVARVPRRAPDEVAARSALAISPERVEIAVALARLDIQRARTLADPRYLGRAQATLSRWWTLRAPPPEVLLLRATIEQSLHVFGAARADLDELIRSRPDDVQAHLTRAVVATVTGDYPAARTSCAVVARYASSLASETCIASVHAMTGDAAQAYRRLARALGTAADRDPTVRAWALTTLAEIAIQRGDRRDASDQLRSVLAIDPDDVYALGLLADVLLDEDRAGDASSLLAGRDQADALLLRRAIAEHRMQGPEAGELARRMRARIAAAAERGDRVHRREEARFALEVDGDPARAAELAADNWSVQHELADARLLLACAVAAGRPQLAAPVVAWAHQNRVRDAALDRFLERLGAR